MILFLFFPLSINPVLYLSSSCFLSYFFFKKKDFTYILFLLWLFFLNAFFRRLHDFHFGRNEQNVVLLAPVFALFWPIFEFIKGIFQKKKFEPLMKYMFIMIACFGYGLIYGLLLSGLKSFLPELKIYLSYLCGISSFVYLLNAKLRYTELLEKLIFQAKFFLIVFGVYGVWQNFSLAPWDQAWVENGGLASAFGKDSIRIWGTLNATSSYATLNYFFVFLILTCSNRKVYSGFFSKLAIIMGVVLIFISQVRLVLIGLFLTTFFLRKKNRRFFVSFFLKIMIVVFLIGTSSSEDSSVSKSFYVLIDRYSTLQDIEGDGSYQARKQAIPIVYQTILNYPLGNGFGQIFDSGFLSTISSLGIPIGILYYFVYFSFLKEILNNRRLQFRVVAVFLVIFEFFSAFVGVAPFSSFILFFTLGLLILEKRELHQENFFTNNKI